MKQKLDKILFQALQIFSTNDYRKYEWDLPLMKKKILLGYLVIL